MQLSLPSLYFKHFKALLRSGGVAHFKHSLTIFILAIVMNQAAFSQDQHSFKKLLRQNTERQLKEIVDASTAITGLMAIDIMSGESFAINDNIIFPQASAIKITILMEVYKQANAKKFSLNDMREIQQPNIVGGSGILKDLEGPLSLSIRNLCILMIMLSDNTATNSLIDLVGMSAINASLQSMGFKNTRVQRKMIDAAASGLGKENISTPAEAAAILLLLHNGKFIDSTTSSEILSVLHKGNREGSRLAGGIPAGVTIGFKPGNLSGVSTEWAIIDLPQRPYIVAIMQNYKVEGHEENTMEKISKVLYDYFWRTGNATRYGTYVDPKLIK